MPTYPSDGVQLRYRETRAATDALPVLLLHAFPVHGESFEPQLEALGHRYRFLVPDARGFGRNAASGLGDGPLEMGRIAKDALALLDHLGLPGAVVAGCSMGGYAAMAMLREDAGRVRGLVLIDSRDTADDEAGKRRREETAQTALSEGIEPLVAAMLPKLLSPNATESAKLAVKRQIRAASPEAAASAARGMALRPDSRELLARFSGPALVVAGERDTVTPPEGAREMAGRIPGALVEIIPDVGHLSHFEAPEPFNRMLDLFLSRI